MGTRVRYPLASACFRVVFRVVLGSPHSWQICFWEWGAPSSRAYSSHSSDAFTPIRVTSSQYIWSMRFMAVASVRMICRFSSIGPPPQVKIRFRTIL